MVKSQLRWVGHVEKLEWKMPGEWKGKGGEHQLDFDGRTVIQREWKDWERCGE